ncbi:rhodanese-like domain-containing protein [Aquimarina sp. TRL1]|uniref:rhodanese-like domain-containing protein n=1 Tax=Aquimarina sp. (strain TRL1) TaxID=2736252 RepID=UPI001C37BDA0|nr:rhodanese-like domain-containing protein [Aquimarina sp. TRL1]
MKEQIKYYQDKLAYEIDAADLFLAIENKDNIIIIDTRKASGYTQEHLPNSINIPHAEMNEITTRHLDKKTTYICYCDGIGCNASTKGALKMAQLGFAVKELLGGIEWWKFDGYATEGTRKQEGTTIHCTC